MSRRAIRWLKAANKDFQKFPVTVQREMANALRTAAIGETADIAKPMKGLGRGVFELALAYRRDAYRAIYAVQIGDDVWVIHAFQKKSTRGVRTPLQEIDTIKERLKRLKEMLR